MVVDHRQAFRKVQNQFGSRSRPRMKFADTGFKSHGNAPRWTSWKANLTEHLECSSLEGWFRPANVNSADSAHSQPTGLGKSGTAHDQRTKGGGSFGKMLAVSCGYSLDLSVQT